ncbi:general stress protein [Rhodococcus sp. X156]|uniref:general stress protein n=1 Tax=Rhodococcus sp. X156 TaxID=2499145 RepID=UPI000FD926CB|nr:general stress protein [Rhodococcus sp. X156]
MTSPMSNRALSNQGKGLSMPTPPTGWPIGSYPTYAEAQRAVDYLSDREFSVEDVTIVGVDLMQVERVLGRLTWPKVLGAGAASGAWLGVFVGLLLSLFGEGGLAVPLITGIVVGVVFGLISGAMTYGATKGQRDFSSTMQLVAGRYDVLCEPRTAERARDLLSKLSMGNQG